MQWCRKKIASGVGSRLNRNLDKPKKEKEKKEDNGYVWGGGGLLSRPSPPPPVPTHMQRDL